MSASGSTPPLPPTVKSAAPATRRSWVAVLGRFMAWVLGLAAASVVVVVLLVGIAVAVAYPNVPEISGLTDYRPKLPMRIYAADGVLLGEFGEERRTFTPIGQIPKVMKDAVLAAEDSRFYEHGGVDYRGIVRAALANLRDARSQGGSTITITSLGKLGGLASTPVINHPEVAILGINKSEMRPVIRDGEIVARLMMNLSASFDHRIVDGYDGASLVQSIKALLEYPATIFV